jgi:hypothetical protein
LKNEFVGREAVGLPPLVMLLEVSAQAWRVVIGEGLSSKEVFFRDQKK